MECFVISFSNCLLLVSRNVSDFCLVTLYPPTLLNLSVLTLCALGFSKDLINSKKIILLLIVMLFFSCLIAFAWNSNTMLNKHGEIGHPCLGS